jgi:purine-binding chemotaxis protein CheW
MDISKIRKKHKEAKKKPESKEPEEVGEPEQPEEEGLAEEPEVTEEPDFTEEPEATEEPETAAQPDVSASEEESAYAADEKESKESIEPEPEQAKPEEAVAEALDQEKGHAQDLVELLTFVLADEYYAFRVTGVHEVLRAQFIANVPRAVDFIVGVTSLRGTIIPVMDLRKRLHIEGGDINVSNIVILKGVGMGIIGVMVDRTVDVIKVQEIDILQPPSHLADSEARFIEGVTSQKDKFISIIDPEELLSFGAMGGVNEK